MECSALFVLARLFRHAQWRGPRRRGQPCYERLRDNGAEERAIRAADEAVVILDDWTRLKTAAGKTNFYPSLLHKG